MSYQKKWREYLILALRQKLLKKSKLSKDGEKVLKILQDKYRMDVDSALMLMQDGGALLATALLLKAR
jgi:hypothetical protein